MRAITFTQLRNDAKRYFDALEKGETLEVFWRGKPVATLAPAIPWFAIGGITLDNVAEVLAHGATRIALVRAILDAADPAEAASAFRHAMDHASEVSACT